MHRRSQAQGWEMILCYYLLHLDRQGLRLNVVPVVAAVLAHVVVALDVVDVLVVPNVVENDLSDLYCPHMEPGRVWTLYFLRR